MPKFNSLLLISTLSLSVFATSCQEPVHEQTHEVKSPKNIILFIGDGMGFAQVQAAMLYSDDELNMEKFPVTGLQITSSNSHKITDSGASATAMATGTKTTNRMIGMTPDTIPVPNMIDLMAGKGKKTAVVVSSAITHATPAAFLAHNESRYNYEEIAEQIALNAPIDLFIGGGLKNFNKRKDHNNHIQSLLDRGFVVDTTFDATSWDCHPKQAVFLHEWHLDPAHKGRGNVMVHAVEHAINCLSQTESGFFMMFEGSLIDFAGHDNDSAFLLAEMIDFDQAIGKALNFAKENRETLVVVTSDHETGGLTLVESKPRDKHAYFHFSTDEHTFSLVPVFAFGPGAESFTGMYDNTEIFHKIKQLVD